MTRLTLVVVGQRRSALVASALLIAGCGSNSAVPTATADASAAGLDATAARLDATVTSQSLDATTPVDAASALDAAPGEDIGAPLLDAAADAYNTPRDVVPRDAAVNTWQDAPYLPGGGPPGPWQGSDIGMVARPGDTTATSSAFIVVASGADIGGTADSFHFVHQPMAGDGEIIARVAALNGAEPASKAGVMFRASLDPNAATVMLAVVGDPNGGGRLQVRASTGLATTIVGADMGADTGVKAGQFLRLTRVGRVFTAYRSANRATWTRVGSAEADLPSTAYVGLAVEAHSTSNTVQAVFNYAAIDNLASDPASAVWEALDVGTLGGSVAYGAGTLVVIGFGEPFTAAQDYFSSVVQPVSGSYRLTTRVIAQSSTLPEARVGLMFREGLTSTASRMSAQASISVSPDKGVQFFSRDAQGGMTVAGARNMDAKPLIWLRLEKLEMGAQDQFTGWYSADGNTWTMLDQVKFSVAQPLLMGMVVGAGNTRAANVATFDEISATPLLTDGGAGDAGPEADAGAD
jgi:hypothetical protein